MLHRQLQVKLLPLQVLLLLQVLRQLLHHPHQQHLVIKILQRQKQVKLHHPLQLLHHPLRLLLQVTILLMIDF